MEKLGDIIKYFTEHVEENNGNLKDLSFSHHNKLHEPRKDHIRSSLRSPKKNLIKKVNETSMFQTLVICNIAIETGRFRKFVDLPT